MTLPCVLTLGLIIDASWWIPVVLADGLLAAVALVDMFTVPSARRLFAFRECDTICSLGERHRVRLVIDNRTRRQLVIEVRDDQLSHFEFTPEEVRVTAPPRSRVHTHYTMVPMKRGTFRMEAVYLRTTSRLGLWRRIYRKPFESQIRVYPDLKQISRYSLYARANRLNLLGVRKARRIGSDNEFERLREYSTDDNYKYIDWRATGRRRKLIVRDFQANQSQRLVFLIDCGRMMVNEAAGLSLLDHALDSMLMLSHVALSRGDQVGVLAFSDHIHQWIPLGGTTRHQNRIIHAVHDLYPELVESRFDSAFMYLNRHCRKRTLVILITNLIDDVNAKQVEAQMSNLTGRHLPLFVFLRDHDLFDAVAPAFKEQRASEPAFANEEAFYCAAAAADILDWRAQLLGDLRRKGVLTLDVFPEQITAPLINEYLRIKAQHLL